MSHYLLLIVLLTTIDKKPQLHFASTKLLLTATSESTRFFPWLYLETNVARSASGIPFLKDYWSLAGKVNKGVNQVSKPIKTER